MKVELIQDARNGRDGLNECGVVEKMLRACFVKRFTISCQRCRPRRECRKRIGLDGIPIVPQGPADVCRIETTHFLF